MREEGYIGEELWDKFVEFIQCLWIPVCTH